MSRNKIIPYKPYLRKLARKLRSNSTQAEVILWKNIKNKVTGYEFHRQVPIHNFIVDFYCHELMLAIEVDGYTHNYNFEADNKRQKTLEGLGVIFVRITDEDVKKHLSDVLRIILVKIEEIEGRTFK